MIRVTGDQLKLLKFLRRELTNVKLRRAAVLFSILEAKEKKEDESEEEAGQVS